MDYGEQVLDALAQQGYGIVYPDDDHVILTAPIQQDGSYRVRIVHEGVFHRNGRVYRDTLRMLLVGLVLEDGFVPPAGYEDL